MNSRAAIWSVLLAGLLAGPARADDLDQAREHYRKGTVAYDLQHYVEAAQEYEAAFRLKDDPAILFNLGQAYRLAGDYEKAIGFYRAYLRRAPQAENRRDVSARIAEMMAIVESQKKAKNAPPAGTFPPTLGGHTETGSAATSVPAHPETPIGTTPTTEPTTTPVTTAVEPAPIAPIAPTAPTANERRARGRTLKITGLVVGGAGMALLIGGIAAGTLTQSAADSLSQSNAQHKAYDAGVYSTWQNNQLATGVLLGVGGAAVIGGAVMFALGVRRARAAPRAFSLMPVWSPRFAGAAVSWEF